MKPYAVAFVLVAIAASAQETLPPQIRAQAARLEVAMRSVEDYCREVDTFTSGNQPSVLTADSANSTWQRLLTNASATHSSHAPYAFVWMRDDRIVAVKMWTPELGKRFEPSSYCFRSDGSLARVSVAARPSRDRDQAKLRKTIAVDRQWFFDEAGRRIGVGINQQDPAPLKSETTKYVYPDVRLFNRVRDLPFAGEMSDGPTGPLTKVSRDRK
jgi:hypothetical protein